jgi:beta-galactosidase
LEQPGQNIFSWGPASNRLQPIKSGGSATHDCSSIETRTPWARVLPHNRNPPATLQVRRDQLKVDRRAFNKLAGSAGMLAWMGLGEAGPAHAEAMPVNDNPGLWNRYFLGTAYYPEWWEPSEWEVDFRQMQELGINTLRMGEFAWASFEPAPGKFEFSWMDRAIALANHYGIDTILGTPTASVPPWLYQLHPDVLSGNDAGPYTYGGRKGYCTSSQNYLDASARIVTALAEHYGRHPGVIGWQLDNEPGFPFQAYDPVSEKAFQLWLQKRYKTLDELNRVWNGKFWSNQYSDWSQIHFPTNSAEGGWQPAISLDYRRFFSDSFLNNLRRQATILHARSENQFIFTNWPSTTWSVDVFAAAADFLNATAWDNYCSAPGLGKFQHQYISGFNNDLARCAGPNQRFLCAEQIAYVPPNALNQGLRLQAYINLAHGSHGHLYFEWRRPLAGNEQFRPSFIKGFDGEINPQKPIFAQVGKEFARLGPPLAGAITRSDIALLYDFTNQWSQGFWSVGDKDRKYDSEAGRYYNGFKVLQRNIDFIPMSADFPAYKLIVAPNLHLVDNSTVERLVSYVAGGGILVLNYRAGTQYMDASMRRVVPPGAFAEIAGVIAEAKLDLVDYTGIADQFEISFSGTKSVFRPRTILESLTLRGAETIATFQGGRMAGQPAITRNRHGLGSVFYVGTDSADDLFHETLARAVAAAGKLTPLIAAPYGVEVVSREDATTTYYFLLNLTEDAHLAIALPHPMADLITEREGLTELSLGPLEVAVLASPKSQLAPPAA